MQEVCLCHGCDVSLFQINGVASENMSLEETRQLIEKSDGRLTLHVLRDNSQFLVNIPQVRDSDSESSRLDGEAERQNLNREVL